MPLRPWRDAYSPGINEADTHSSAPLIPWREAPSLGISEAGCPALPDRHPCVASQGVPCVASQGVPFALHCVKADCHQLLLAKASLLNSLIVGPQDLRLYVRGCLHVHLLFRCKHSLHPSQHEAAALTPHSSLRNASSPNKPTRT